MKKKNCKITLNFPQSKLNRLHHKCPLKTYKEEILINDSYYSGIGILWKLIIMSVFSAHMSDKLPADLFEGSLFLPLGTFFQFPRFLGVNKKV